MINRHNYRMCVAQDFLCVPAVLQTILLYSDIHLKDEDIVGYFSVFIPESNEDIKGIKTNNPNEYGVKLKTNSLNDFFKYFNIPLHEDYLSIFNY